MNRVLVTGASGFIGQPAIRQLAALGHEVHAVSRSAAAGGQAQGNRACAPGTIIWHTADLLAADTPRALFAGIRPSHWLHLAWITDSPAYWTSAANFEWLAASTQCLAAFTANGGQRVVAAGSCAEYRWQQEFATQGPVDAATSCREAKGWCLEASTPLEPATLYGAAKHALSTVQQAWCRQQGVGHAWGRVFHLYGPGEAQQRFVPAVINALLDGRPALCTSGLQQRDLLHVDDVAAAFVRMLTADHQGPFNIASAVPVTLATVAQCVAEYIGRSDLLQLGALAPRAGDPPLLCGDNAILSASGWAPARSLADGLQDCVEYWRAHR